MNAYILDKRRILSVGSMLFLGAMQIFSRSVEQYVKIKEGPVRWLSR